MKVEVPEFVKEMSNQLNQQDNRMTADPLFEVRYKKYIVTEQDYNEHHWEIINEEGDSYYHSEKDENYDELATHLFEYNPDWCAKWLEYHGIENKMNPDRCPGDYTDLDAFKEVFCEQFDYDCHDLPEGFKKIHMQEIEVTVNSHFTESDAEAFIDRKQHDYPPLYTYAISLCYCYNMAELRRWLISLTKNDV